MIASREYVKDIIVKVLKRFDIDIQRRIDLKPDYRVMSTNNPGSNVNYYSLLAEVVLERPNDNDYQDYEMIFTASCSEIKLPSMIVRWHCATKAVGVMEFHDVAAIAGSSSGYAFYTTYEVVNNNTGVKFRLYAQAKQTYAGIACTVLSEISNKVLYSQKTPLGLQAKLYNCANWVSSMVGTK